MWVSLEKLTERQISVLAWYLKFLCKNPFSRLVVGTSMKLQFTFAYLFFGVFAVAADLLVFHVLVQMSFDPTISNLVSIIFANVVSFFGLLPFSKATAKSSLTYLRQFVILAFFSLAAAGILFELLRIFVNVSPAKVIATGFAICVRYILSITLWTR